MKKRMLCLLLTVTTVMGSAMPAYSATWNQPQQLFAQSQKAETQKSAADIELEPLVTEINVVKADVALSDTGVTVTTLDILKNENGNTDEMNNTVSFGVYDTKLMEAQTFIESISNVITESQEEIQRLVEEERKAEEERKRKEEEERKRKEEEERKRKEEQKKQAAANSKAAGEKIVAYAKQFVGNPYVWGGNSLTKGIDCSHFVYQVLKNCGYYDGPYVTSTYWRTKGKAVSSLAQAQAGDIICYKGHVAIYDGKGMIVEAKGKKWGITHDRSAKYGKIYAIRRFV